jgi:hypothetical protein
MSAFRNRIGWDVSMKTFKWLGAVMACALVSACGGGGGNAGTSPFGNGGTGCAAASAASGAAGCATAANLVLTLSSPTILNDGSQKVTATATATTSSGQAIAGIPISFTVDNNANFTASGSVTAASGQVSAVVSIGADPTNRVVTVQAKSGSLTTSASFAVSGSKLAATTSTAILAPGQAGTVDFRLTNAIDQALAGQPISVTLGTAAPVTGTTDVNGSYTFAFNAPTTLGPTDIVGTAGGISKTQTVLVQTSTTAIPPAVGPILSPSVAANPSVVPTNTVGSTINRTEIRALFVGANNAPIKNVRVSFDLNGDPASIGGTFSTGGSVIYSDSNGIATTAYIPSDRPSPTNGVTIRACYSTGDFTPPQCPNFVTATITVVADPLSVTIGSNNTIIVGPNKLTYQRQYVVLVVDAAGRAKGNVDIVPSIDLPVYYKGQYVHGATWFQGEFIGSSLNSRVPFGCPNEDLNRNAVNETGPIFEDVNHSATLEPRKSDAAVSLIGGSKTKDDGTAIVQIEYPQNVASWLQVKLLVSATGVSGTEGRATWTEILPPPVTAITDAADPPFRFSPYGVVIDPMLLTGTYPDGTPVPNVPVGPCANPN